MDPVDAGLTSANANTTMSRAYGRPLAIAVPLALLIVYMISWVGPVYRQGIESITRQTDFIATATGALIIHDGDGPYLYDPHTQRAAQARLVAPYATGGTGGGDALPPRPYSPAPEPAGQGRWIAYIHPPWEAVLFAPLAELPVSLLFTIWSLLALVALVAAFKIMHSTLPMPRYALPVAVIAMCSYQPVARSFMLGQCAPLILLGLCMVYAATRRTPVATLPAGAGLLLVALKPQALVLVLALLLLHRRWKVLVVFAGMVALAGAAVMPVLGVDWPLRYAGTLSALADAGEAGVHPQIMHNWRGLVLSVLGQQAPALVAPITLLLCLLTVGLVAWCALRCARREPVASGPVSHHGSHQVKVHLDLLWALVVVGTALISPHLYPHDLTIMLLPAWIIAAYASSGIWTRHLSTAWLTLLWAGYAVIPVTFYADMIFDMPALTIVPGVLLLALVALRLAGQQARGPLLNAVV